jgi:hypothetical protein
VAAALFHFREHLPRQYAKTRPQVVADCPDYRLVADVTNATKHRILDRDTSEGPPIVNSAEDIDEITVVTRYEDEQGEYADARTLVFVNCHDGVRRDLDTALTNVLNYWGNELKRWGIVDFAPRRLSEPPGTRFVPRSEAQSPNFEIVQGLRWKQMMQLQKFDPSKGSSAPIDLTGVTNLEFKIYKPRYSVDITMNSPDLSEPVRCSIDFTEEQSFAVAALKTDAERNAYVKSVLAERQKAVRDAITATLQARSKAQSEGES